MMSKVNKKCPTCGQVLLVAQSHADGISSVEQLLDLLSLADRELYRTRDGDWAITYTHNRGLIPPTIVQAAIETGKLYRVYADADECFWLKAQTIDMKATVALRRTRNTRDIVYTKEPIRA